MSRRGWLVFALGLGAVAVLGGFSPWVYRRYRLEQILRRLEAGDDAEARRDLAEVRGSERAGERLARTGNRWLAVNLVCLAECGDAGGSARRGAFEACFPLSFGATQRLESPGDVKLRDTALLTTRVADSLWEIVDSQAWSAKRFPAQPSAGGVEFYLQYFLSGEGKEARPVYVRGAWVLHPPGRTNPIIETLDLTDIPDPLFLFPRRPVRVILESGESALELRLGGMAAWRQFVPGQRLFEGSVAYAVYLVGKSSGREPFLLGYVGVSAVTALGKWFAEDSVVKKPLENLDRGAHPIAFHVPESVQKLAPLDRLTLLFRAAPSFAERNGFQVSPALCLPFERELYLPFLEN